MKKLLLYIPFLALFLFLSPPLYAQSNQTVTTGATTAPVNLPGSCNYSWVNSNPAIGLVASGTGNIAAFTAMNTGSNPITATITATPSSNGFAYISNYADGTISVINIATNKVVSTIKVGYGPEFIAISPDGKRVYVEDTGEGFVSDVFAIDATTDTTIFRSQIVDEPSYGLAVSPDGSKLYIGCVGSSSNGSVTVISTSNFNEISTINFSDSVLGIALSPDGTRLYVTNGGEGNIAVVNTITNSVIANVLVDVYPDQVALSPDGSLLYVCSQISNVVSVIKTATDKVIAVIPVGIIPNGISVSPDGSRIYVANTNSNSISVINGANNAVISTIATGANPTGVSVSPDGKFLYVPMQSSGTVSVINTQTGAITATIPVGSFPHSLGNFISAGIGCGKVTVTITVNPQPYITISAVSGAIYACEGSVSTASTIQQFTVSGSYLSGDITATAPPGFELSLNSASGYSTSLTLTSNNGTVSNSIIYVRSSASASAGNISGSVVLSSAGTTDQSVSVNGIINEIPVLSTPAPQTLVNGAISAPVNFTGTGSTYSWVNDTPGIGLAASGTGDILAFASMNNTNSPATATITVTPLNSTGCNGIPVKFTITVEPTPTSLSATGTLTSLITVYGTASPSEIFYVSGTSITSGIFITAPPGFGVSTDGINFNSTATIQDMGTVLSIKVSIRLAATTPAGDYNGNIILSSSNAADVNISMPAGTVTPAPITITASNKTRLYGVVNPPLTVTYSGFVNNEGPAQLTSLPTVTTNATVQSIAGQYAITVSGAVAQSYAFTYVDGILTIIPAGVALLIPNIFTPNGDGINDTWEISSLYEYPGCKVDVFNRYGQLLYHSVGYAKPWDGTFHNSPVPAGTYYYTINLNNQSPISGYVTVIR